MKGENWIKKIENFILSMPLVTIFAVIVCVSGGADK